jgi:hypothetical protein
MLTPTTAPATYNVLQLAEGEPAAIFFRQSLGLPAGTRLTVLIDAPAAPLTLLFEVFDPFNPARPQKRYLFCNDPANPAQVTAITPEKARQLVGLLSHPEIRVITLPVATAIDEYRRLEADTPSYETIRRGEPRFYLPPKLE